MSTDIQGKIVSDTANVCKTSLLNNVKAYVSQPKTIVIGVVIVICILLFYAYTKDKWPFTKKEGAVSKSTKQKNNDKVKNSDKAKDKDKNKTDDEDDSNSQEIDEIIDRINEKQKSNRMD